jgi:hypothetical protein
VCLFAELKKLFKADDTALNLDETNFIKCAINNETCISLNIGYDNNN